MRFPFSRSPSTTPHVAPAHVAPADVRALQAQHPGLVLLDVRTPFEFQAGHLPGSSLVPVDRVAGAIPRLQRAAHPILVVCQSGARATMAAATLQAAGVSGVSLLTGGIAAWRRHGLALESGLASCPLPDASPSAVEGALA